MRANIVSFLGARALQVAVLRGLRVVLGVSAVVAGVGLATAQMPQSIQMPQAAQTEVGFSSSAPTLQAANLEPLLPGYSSSAGNLPGAAPRAAITSSRGAIPARPVRPFSQFGIDAHVGMGGIGFDTATPLARHFNLR